MARKPKTLRTLEPFEALQTWALVASEGPVKSAFRTAFAGGTKDAGETEIYWHVERFFARQACRQFRPIAMRLELEGREPEKHERREAYAFSLRYQSWYAENPCKVIE